jgi:two-component system, LytTR family, sensor kinase
MKGKKYIEPIIHVLVWGSGFILFTLLIKTIGPFKRADQTLFMPVSLGTMINLILFYSISLVLIPRFSRNKKTWELIFLTLGLFFLLTSGETIIDYLFFTYYYSSIRESFASQFMLNTSLNLIMLAFALGYGFTKIWLTGEKLKQALKQEKLLAELNFLKSQINPHFLFNVLNMAFSSATCNGDEKTADIIEKLSGLMRYMLYESNVDRVNLEKEIEFLNNYIKLQKMRLSSDISTVVTFQVNGSINHSQIAPLILIPFIENAFKYGISLDHPGEILILLNIHGKQLEFRVQNKINVLLRAIDKKNSGIGLVNVRKRLELLYPGKHKLEIDSSGGMFSVELLMTIE